MTHAPLHRQQHHVQCIAPWTHLYCQESSYGPCCDILYRVGKNELSERLRSTSDYLGLFNSEQFRNLRRMFLDGEPPYACKVCIACGYHKPFDQSMARRDFTEIAEAEFLTPRSFSLIVESPCNIRCVFCKSIRDHRDPDKDFDTFNAVFLRLEEVGWENITGIRIGGGEPFFNPGFNRFIRSYDWTRLQEAPLKITTNGTLLHKHLDALARVRRAEFTISVDATGKVYESLRRGASWDRVRANLETLSQYMRQRPGWKASIHSIVMKSTLPHLAELMRLCHRLGFGFSAMNIHGKYFEENIFLFPDLLRGRDWEFHFNESIDVAAQYGFTFAHKELHRLRQYLRDKLNGIHKPIRGFSNDEDRLAHLLEFFASLKDRSYGVLGVDNKFIEVCQAAERLAGLQFVADKAENISDFMGYTFLNTDTLIQNPGALDALRDKIDLLVVTCPSWEYGSYAPVANELFPNTEKILAPIWDRKAWDNLQRVASTAEPMVGFCTGGAANMLLEGTPLGKANIVAFADNNPKLHGTSFYNRPVVPLSKVAEYANTVVILSEGFSKEISRQITEHYGQDVTVMPLFA